ncbi:hypothetical protein OEZ85_002979 [Tetradesmus obliquus]|uniref:Low temperature requirement A n=1 Tax=Tetradesmus obliquus TaxID=3088 RepID=A0ABY8TZ78_TETOB|nr:hypothetical protein OEZ85_002979 [Tetradesmus obliquus]
MAMAAHPPPGSYNRPRGPGDMRGDYRPLAAAPQLHQDWDEPQDEQRSVTWPELFFDLFFVAAISNLSHLFEERPDAPNAGRVVLYHALVFFLWSEYTMLKTRYRLRGLLFRVVGLGLQLGLLGFIIATRADAQWPQLLAGGYACARMCIAATHVIIAWCIPRARKLSAMTAVAGLALAAAPAWLAWQKDAAYALHVKVMAAVAAGEFIEPLLPTLAPQADIPLHVQHMSERLGQLVMLHLGEAIIGIAATPLESTVPQFTAVALAATLAWALHLIYYHVEPDEHNHAYRQSRMRGLLYFYCHWLLTVALLLTGSGLRLLLGTYPSPHHAQQEPLAPLDTSLMLCIAYGFSLHMLAAIRGAHYLGLEPQHRAVRAVSRAGVKGWWLGWWLMLGLWPLPVYLLPLLIWWLNGPAATAGAASAGGNGMYSAPCLEGERVAVAASIGGSRFTGCSDADSLMQQGSASLGLPMAGLLDSSGSISVTLLLSLLAGHAVLLVLTETLFAHMITKTPLVGGADGGNDTPQGPAQEEDEL